MKIRKQAGLSLISVMIIFMLLGALAMGFLYTIRTGRLPLNDQLQRWGKSAGVISNELKNAAGVSGANGANTAAPASGTVAPNENMPAPVTVESGVKKCVINGRTTYSDTECNQRADAKNVKLHDAKGFERPKPKEDDSSASVGDQDFRQKMLNKAIDKASR
ncbi:PulJ/GspJ family protein [Undibacterium luofuense]|uniref:Uncharacterized protein n=1 Tax=Undibacterium luofuense TaxID=2828733 RepID=A0A941DHW4_9BURK|nr:hypothetical protein [Undibacterium luofuense]MBR7781063.1 hypothetical protein [Undibacterium luofuense]